MLQTGALAHRALGDESEIELERVGHHLPQAAEAKRDDLYLSSLRVLDAVSTIAALSEVVH